MAPKRKYDNNYIKFGFTSIESNGEIKPQCVICAIVLANDALKPAKLKRHLETVHPHFSDQCFALQCDESTDISNCCQLLVFVRFLDDDKEELLISRELETTSKGIDVMNTISEYIQKHNIIWEKIVGFCTDGAPAMLGSRSGLATLVKQKNPKAITSHCIIHRQALASKTLPGCLNNTMQLAIKVVKVIKSSTLNTRLLKNYALKWTQTMRRFSFTQKFVGY